MKPKSLIKELYDKSLKQQKDINDEIAKIQNNQYPIDTINRIKEKIKEKIENFHTSISLLHNSIFYIQQDYDRELWRKHHENLIIAHKNLKKILEETIVKAKQKYNYSDAFYSNDADVSAFGNNVNHLAKERDSLNCLIKMSSEIESNAIGVNGELDSQAFSVGKIKDKISGIYGQLVTSQTYTTFMIKRGYGDTILCLIFGIVTLLIIYYSYYYLKPKIR